jgi:hypothetical protein
VAVLLADVRLDARDPLGEPAAVRDRDHPVLHALPEERRDAELVELEAPRTGEGEVVVAPAADPVRERAIEVPLRVLGALAGEDGGVHRRQERHPHVLDLLGRRRAQLGGLALEVRLELLRPRERGLELLDVLLALPREPVDPLRRVRRRRGDRGRGETAFGARAAGEGVRAAARAAERDVALDVERVEHVLDVRDDVHDRAPRVPRRGPVAGAVVAHDPQAALARELEVGRIAETAARRPVMLDNDVPVRIPLVEDVERPAVAEGDVELAHSPGLSGVPGRPSGNSCSSRRATGSGTSADTSPPNAAISFTPLDETKLTCGLAIT